MNEFTRVKLGQAACYHTGKTWEKLSIAEREEMCKLGEGIANAASNLSSHSMTHRGPVTLNATFDDEKETFDVYLNDADANQPVVELIFVCGAGLSFNVGPLGTDALKGLAKFLRDTAKEIDEKVK